MKKNLLFILCLLLASVTLHAQNGYIYIHTSTLDESSNPTGLNKGFSFTGIGSGSNPGSTTIDGFILNDAPDYTTIVDIGVASTGTFFATTAAGLYYRKANSAAWVLAPNTAGATKVDGCIGDQAIYIPSGSATVQLFDVATNQSYQMMSGSNFTDVAFDRVNSRVVALTGGVLYYKTLTGTTVNTISTVANSSTIAAARIDVDNTGKLLVASTSNTLETVANYTTTPVISNLGAPAASGLSGNGTIAMYDIAAADDGTYIVIYGKGPYYYSAWKYNGTAGSFTNERSSGLPNNITGGPGGQFWSTYYTINPGVVSVYTRMLNGTTATWFDDERVRTTVNTNSQLISVAPGTYTITETPNTPDATWNLQKVTIYDPATTSTSTSNVTNSTATITVAAGQTVHAIFQNYYNPSTVTFNNNCTTASWSENFGTGSENLTTGHMIGATSYHYNGSSDGYFGIAPYAGGIYDHTTGNNTGDFIWFNASYQKDVFYQRSFAGMVPGNTYTLTFWVNSYSNGTAANITAQVTDPVSGALLNSVNPATGATTPGSITTGPITTLKTWIKETFTFTPGPSQTTANFSILNNGSGGDGNDVGIDDISVVLQPATSPALTVQNACSNAPSVTVTAPLGSAYEYSIDGTNYQSGTTFTGLTPGTSYTVYARYTSSTNCAAYTTIVLPGTNYTWKGSTTSSDPTVATNWSTGVAPPFDGTASITIPVVASGYKYPVLTASESIFSLTIAAPGATTPNLNLGKYTLNVGCNIVNGGILNSGTDLTSSTINWNGSSANQSYTGNSAAGSASLGNMTVNNTYASGSTYGTITISGGPVDIYNYLTMGTGLLTVQSGTSAGILTLKSTASSTATFTALPSSYPYAGQSGTVLQAVTGNVNAERYLTGGPGYRSYRLLSSPVYVNTVSGVNVIGLKYINTTVGSNHGALVGGPGGNANGFDVANGNPTIYLYDESKALDNKTFTGSKNIGIYSFTGVSGVFSVNSYQFTTIYGTTTTPGVTVPVGNSYIFFFIGDNSSLVTSTSRTPENTTITATGSLNQGTIPFTLWANNSIHPTYTSGSYAAGYHQVGNPYASSISLDKFFTDNYDATNNPISSTFYELMEPGQTYISYNYNTTTGTGTSSSTKIGSTIVSGQGFIAGVTAANQTLTFKEDQKVNVQLVNGGTPSLLLSLKLPTGLAGMHLQLTSGADTTQNTQTGVYFNSLWSDAFKGNEDAIDLGGVSPKVSLSSYTSDNQRVGINEMGSYLKNKRVRLYVNATATGQYHIGRADIKNIDTLYNVYIVDKLLKDSADLRGNKPYDFTINTSDTTTFGANRFELAVELKQLAPYQLLSFTGTKASAGIQLQWKTANEGSFTGFTLQKQSGTAFAGIDSLQGNGSGTYSFTDVNPTLGVNTYRLVQNGLSGNITYSDLVKVTIGGGAANGLTVYPNPAHAIINVNTNASAGTYKLNIYNSFGGVMKQQTVSGTAWAEDVSAYNDGTYIIEMTDAKGKFAGKAKFVKVK